MKYIQVLLRAKSYWLCWIPEKFAVKGKQLKINNVIWTVKSVYDMEYEEVWECGKLIWASDVPPLEGEKLQERLKQYKKLNKNIEEVKEQF